ncbi:MAG: hypothetical protein H0T93_04795 [Chloroflexia bacterium]|nr:hypothetical protein [Chloroflexia bacterium]
MAGSGARDRVSRPKDAAELRAELARVSDRLSFYEGFDRVIAENVRRSGELMLEMLTMRDAMAASADSEDRQERDRILARLAEMDAGLQVIRTQVEAMADQVNDLRQSLGSEHQPVPPLAPEMASATPMATGPDWKEPQVIDIIVHQVNKATIALSLQRYLGKIDTVAGVEAREFAEGVLRMQVTAHQPLTREDLSGWSEGGSFTVLQVQPHIIELTLGGGG